MTLLTIHGILSMNTNLTLLDQVGHIHRHFVDLRVVELFNILYDKIKDTYPEHAHVFRRHKIDRDTLATETTTAANPMDIVLTVGREIIAGKLKGGIERGCE
ncbi:hypothetical protein BC936DRAFT_137584 [Jimgerdemannia flammicorona]|uniref:Uncharacterized protein n=1 Tax=Jimgerdemannia flammicorona TaxID=994334 RepID=A0A433CX09_9FUNG|nr:hypothetical protein BC936DRAFT_137584 [Jimgerdemannia flammicorona]